MTTAFLRYPDLPSLVTVPDDALVAVWSGGRLYAAPRSSVGGGGGGSDGYATVQSNGVDLQQRSTLNVTGLLQASDSGGKTLLHLPSIALASQVSGILPFANGGTGLSSLGTALQSYRVNALGTGIEWYTPSAGLAAPANPLDNGKPAIASAGNLIYSLLTAAHLSASAAIANTQLASMSAARLMGRDTGAGTPVEIAVGGGVEFTGGGDIQRSAVSGAVSIPAGSNTSAFASGDFGALDLKTTGYFRLGLAPGSGSGVASSASVGAIRGPRGADVFSAYVRNNGDTADVLFFSWDSGVNRIQIGQTGAGGNSELHLNALTQLRLRAAGSTRVSVSSLAMTLDACNYLNFGSLTTSPVIGQEDDASATTTGDLLTVHSQDCSGTTAVTGGGLVVRAGDATGGSGTRTGGNCTMRPGAGATAGGSLRLQSGAGTSRVEVNDTGLGFFAASPVAKPTVTGSRGGNAALASLITALANLGLLTDSSTA